MLVIQSKKTNNGIKISEIGNIISTDHVHDKYITTQEFHKLTSQSISERLAQAYLASKSYIANFLKKRDYDKKLNNVISNKYGLSERSKKVKAISTKGLTKFLINKVSILNGGKCFSSRIFQNNLVFTPADKYIKYFSGTIWVDSWKLMECQKKILKI